MSIIHAFNGTWRGDRILNTRKVICIGEALEESAEKRVLYPLKANAEICYKGSELLGNGFIIGESEARHLMDSFPSASDVVNQLVNGKEFSSMPEFKPIRWVINFRDMTELAARKYTAPFAIIEQRVKPEREFDKRPARRERFWRFGEIANGLYTRLARCELAIARLFTCEYWFWDFVTPGPVFTNALIVVADGSGGRFAALSSSLHEVWASLEASSLVTRFRYTPSRCFDTFPFPLARQDLTDIGSRYHEFRHQLMRTREEGLTKTYSSFHHSAEKSEGIAQLRTLHAEMDQTVATAYGWSDLDLDHDFHETKHGVRYTIGESARRTVIDRLFALNQQRYEEEIKAGYMRRKCAGRGDGHE